MGWKNCFPILCLLAILALTATSQGTSTGSMLKDRKMTWAYQEVRPGAFMFWWLYYTEGTENYLKTPLVIWLQGGPGGSSTGFGNFMEIGPQDVLKNNRTNNWVNSVNVLFIDSPVGTGFSYVNDTKLLTTNNTQITTDLVQLLIGFMGKVPEFQTIPLYIFSESYGGKVAIQFALKLTKAIQKGKIKCNPKGVSLGDSWISPIDSVLSWAPFLYSTSLVDNNGFVAINSSAYKVKDALEKEKFAEATKLWADTEDVIANYTNGVSVYNILQTPASGGSEQSIQSCRMSHLLGSRHPQLCNYHTDQLYQLMNGEIKEMLRIIPPTVTWGGQSELVFEALAEDFMKPVTRIVESVLNNTLLNVNVYSGQLDLIVDTIGTTKWVDQINWLGIRSWKLSKRTPIILRNDTVGFVKSFKNFNFYWILKAGHMVPSDAPEAGVEMLRLMTGSKSR